MSQEKEKIKEVTGKVQFRESRLFGKRKLILQVQIKGFGFVPEWGDYFPYHYWVDATAEHLKSLPEATLMSALTDLERVE